MKRLPKFSRQTNKIQGGIPPFAGKSEEEEARFWDTHSPLDYPDEFTDVKEPFEFAPSLIRKAAQRRKERKRQLTNSLPQNNNQSR